MTDLSSDPIFTTPSCPSPLQSSTLPTTPSDSGSETGSPVMVERPPLPLSYSEPAIPTLTLGEAKQEDSGNRVEIEPTLSQKSIFQPEELMHVIEPPTEPRSIPQCDLTKVCGDEPGYGPESNPLAPVSVKPFGVSCVTTSTNVAKARVHNGEAGKRSSLKQVNFVEPKVDVSVAKNDEDQAAGDGIVKKVKQHRPTKIDIQNDHKIDIKIELKPAPPASVVGGGPATPSIGTGCECKCGHSCADSKQGGGIEVKGQAEHQVSDVAESGDIAAHSKHDSRRGSDAKSQVILTVGPLPGSAPAGFTAPGCQTVRAGVRHRHGPPQAHNPQSHSEHLHRGHCHCTRGVHPKTSGPPTSSEAKLQDLRKASTKGGCIDRDTKKRATPGTITRPGITKIATNTIQVLSRYAKELESHRSTHQVSREKNLFLFLGVLIAVMMYFQTLMIVLLAFFFGRK